MKKADRILIAAVIACGVIIVVLKALTAPITTDEAWNYNRWISQGFRTIFTDYSAFNNHILQTALSRVSINLLGNSEFAQRYPSIIAYLIFALTFVKLVESTITNRALRLLCICAVVLHPYILDFAALARGYMLMVTFSTLGVYFIIEALNPDRPRRLLLYLLLASYMVGLAAAAIPSSLRLLPAFLLILLIQPGATERIRLKPVHLAALVSIAVIVTAAFYLPAFHSAKNLSIELGTKSLSDSLQSLRLLLFYIPSATLDQGGNPVPHPETLLLWTGAPGLLQLILAGKVVFILFLTALALITVLPFKYKLGRSALCVHIVWITVLGIILMERYVSGSRLPVGRAWLAIIPLPAISAFSLIERLLVSVREPSKKYWLTMLTAFGAALIIIRLQSFDASTFWEWPDNQAAPEVVDHLAILVPPGQKSSVSCPNYYHACLTYYAQRTGLKEVLIVPGQEMPAAYHLLREDLLDKPVSDSLAIARYPSTHLVLARDPATPLDQ